MKHSPGFLAIAERARAEIKQLTVDEVESMIKKGERFILVDVREDHEWENGHIPDAEHLSKGIIERDIETRFPDKSQTIVLYCGGGYRSALAALNIQSMGYQKVFSMDGGYRSWCAEGRATAMTGRSNK